MIPRFIRITRFFLLLSIILNACGGKPVPTRVTVPTATEGPAPTAAPSPTPAPPVEAQVDPTIVLDQFKPSGIFTVNFNQPMEPGSAQAALLTYPWVDGEAEWDYDYTKLTFKPAGSFQPGRSYRLFLNRELKSQAGAALSIQPEWQIQTLDAPQLLNHLPGTSQLNTRRPDIILTFDRVMDKASVETALQIKPEVPLNMEWSGDTQASVKLTQPLEPGKRYRFTLAETALDTRGVSLDNMYSWEYWLEPLVKLEKGSDVFNRSAPVVLHFNYPVDPDSVAKALTITPLIDTTLDWSTSGTVLNILPNTPLINGAFYTISFNSPLRETNGDEFTVPAPITFSGPPPIVDFWPQPETEVDPDTEIWINFDRPMDHAKTEAAFYITPSVTGRFEWQENKLIFKPSSGFNYYTRYTITLEPTAAGSDGSLVLLDNFQWSFSVRYPSQSGPAVASFGEIGPNAQVLDIIGRRALQYVVSGSPLPENVTFELYRLSLEQFLDRYSSGFRGVAGFQKHPLSTEGTEQILSWVSQTTSQASRGWGGSVQEVIIPENVPAGLYLLNLSSGESTDQLILILTSNNIMLKQAEGQITAWVSRINGGSVPSIQVRVYARDGTLITQGQTDENGVFQAHVASDPQPLIVVAVADSDISACGLSNEWRTSGGYWGGWWLPAPKIVGYATFIYTDRPIYRTGQTVFFKAILRYDDDAVLSTPPPGTPVTVHIRDARDNIVQTYQIPTNEYGTSNGEFKLAEGAMLGEYNVEVVLNNGQASQESHRQIFKVQDYRKPEYQVNIRADTQRYVIGDPVNLTVSANYFFGKPVPNATLNIRRYYLYEYYDYMKDAAQYIWYQDYAGGEPIDGSTNSDGMFYYSFPADIGETPDYNWWSDSQMVKTWGIEVTVDDGSHLSVSNFTVVKVYNAAEQLTVDTGGFLKKPSESFPVAIALKTLDGTPVPDRLLQVELRRWDPSSYGYNSVIQNASVATDAEGKANLPYTIQMAGYYQLRVSGTDSRGNPIFTNEWVYAYSQAFPWFNNFQSDLKVTADKEQYSPGESAHLVIESSFNGEALLVFERGRVHREQIIQIQSPITLLDIPIQSSDSPNIFITVNAWKSQDTTLMPEMYQSLADSILRTASVELNVPVTDKSLTVTITPDKLVYTPRQQAMFTVQVTNFSGQPVQAEVSLGLVDEAIYSLSQELSGPILEAFYARRRDIVRTFDGMSPTRELFVAGRGGGGDDGGNGSPRSDFPDTAAWYPALQTNTKGEATITITLPDNLTSWRVSAKAVTTYAQMGEAYINILTQQPVIVRPILPRNLTAGDQVELSALVHNYSQVALDLNVSIETASDSDRIALQIKEPVIQKLTLKSGEILTVQWTAVAVEAGETQITVRAQPAADQESDFTLSDAVQLPLTINPLAIPDVVSQVGAFDEQLITTLYLPEGALAMSAATLEMNRSIAGNLLTGLEYLTGYPYGCVEQTMSRTLPNAVVSRAFQKLGVANPTLEADMPAMINAGLQRLYGYQHNDGGWGWWFDDATHDYQTAWVVFGLAMTAEAGYPVDSKVIERGAAWLEGNLSQMDIRTRAYALYSLAVVGYGDPGSTLDLAKQVYELDPFSQAALALALHKLGADAQANEVMSALSDSAVVDETGMVYWPQPQEDGHYYEKTMASTTRSTAMALDAFVNITPDHQFLPGIVQWLISQRRQNGWGSTNETSYSIIALTDHMLAEQEITTASGYIVTLNDQIIASGTLGRDQPSFRLQIPASQMLPGPNLLRVNRIGEGKLYYNITNRVYVAQPQIAPAGKVQVLRQYLDPLTGNPITTVSAGQLVQVKLILILPTDGFFLILEDNLPGGLEALNEKLNTTSHEATLYQEERFFWEEYGYNNKEIRGNQVSFFIRETGAGGHVFTYLARATHAGTYIALPAEAYAMYDATVWGRSGSDGFIIVK